MMYKITYVSYIFTTDKGKEIEKTKEYTLNAQSTEDAKYHFLSKKVKHKYIKNITEDNSNSLGNLFPELNDLKNKLN